jgi:hypothetical protein
MTYYSVHDILFCAIHKYSHMQCNATQIIISMIICVFTAIVNVVLGIHTQPSTHKTILGGSFYDFSAGLDYQLPRGATVVIDGHNAIHSMQPASLHDKKIFLDSLERFSHIAHDAFTGHVVHIVLKNYYTGSELRSEQLAFIKECTSISEKHPRIIYHVAQDSKRPSDTNHTAKGRDDLLTVWLARRSSWYIISKDLYRDVNRFIEIGDFEHYTIQKGKIVSSEDFIVKRAVKQLEIPSHANQLLFRFADEYSNGTITARPGSKYKIVNFNAAANYKKETNKYVRL